MSWQTLGTVALSKAWQSVDLPVVGGRLFRVTQNWTGEWPGTGYVQLSAFYADGGRYGFRKVGCSQEPRLVILPVPDDLVAVGFTVRYICVRINSYARLFAAANWSCTVEAWIE